jgi:hypothetical protein
MRYLTVLAAMAMSSVVVTSKAFIYELIVLRLPDASKQSGYRYFIGFSDFHDKQHASSQQQLQDLEQFLAVRSRKAMTKVVLEDLSSCGSGGRDSCGSFYVNSRGGVLGGLAQKCKAMGLVVDNIEYRYCRVASLGPVLNNIGKNPSSFPSVTSTRVSMLATEVDVIAQEIKQQSKGKLRQVSRDALKSVTQQLEDFAIKTHNDMTVAEYVTRHSTPDNRLNFVKHLLTFDSCLIDLKIVQSILESEHYDRVCALAGGAHIDRVAELLQKVGYEVVYRTPVTYHKEYDTSKCVGSAVIDGAYCVRPEPISLNELESLVGS